MKTRAKKRRPIKAPKRRDERLWKGPDGKLVKLSKRDYERLLAE